MFSRIRNSVSRLYNSAVLLILPEVETVLTLIARSIAFLEVREAALERRIEVSINAIVEDGKAHRNALDAVNKHFAKVNARNLTAITRARSDAEAAVSARTAVETLINRG